MEAKYCSNFLCQKIYQPQEQTYWYSNTVKDTAQEERKEVEFLVTCPKQHVLCRGTFDAIASEVESRKGTIITGDKAH